MNYVKPTLILTALTTMAGCYHRTIPYHSPNQEIVQPTSLDQKTREEATKNLDASV